MIPEEAGRPDPAGEQSPLLPERASSAEPLLPAPREVVSPGPAAAPAPPPTAPLPSGLALLAALRRRWLLASLVGLLLAVGVGTAVWFLRPAQYTAFALLRVASTEPGVLDQAQRAGTDFDTYQRTQVVLIKSRPILVAALKQDKVRETPLVWQQPDPIGWLEGQVNAYFIDGTEVLRIEMSGQDPVALATLVNAVKDAYMSEAVNAERTKRLARLAELQKAYETSAGQLRTQRERLRRLADSLKTSDRENLSLEQRLALEEYGVLRKDLLQIQSDLRKAQVTLAVHKARLQAGEAQVPAVLLDQFLDNEPPVKFQLEEVGKLEAKLKDAQNKLQKDAPGLIRVERELQEARKLLAKIRAELRPQVEELLRKKLRSDTEELIAQAQEQIDVLTHQRQAVENEVRSQAQDVKRISSTSFDLEMMRLEIDQAEGTIRSLRAEMERVQLDVRSEAKRVTDFLPAEVPQSKDIRAQVRSATMAALGAFFLGAFLVGFWEFRTRRIGTAEEVASDLGLRVLGTLPALARPRRGQLGAAPDPYWRSVLTESVDALRTILTRSSASAASRVLMITSARDREGKTLLATFLASSLSRAGRRTLLVDADLRRPAIHALLGLPGEPGLCEVLRGEAALEEVIQLEEVTGLSVLPAGRCDAQVIQSLARLDLAGLFEQLRRHFEFVIIDSCPVLPVADSLLIAEHTDGVLLSIRFPVSRTPQVYAAHERLRAVGARVLGTVVQGVGGEFYGYKYQYFTESSPALP